MTKSKVLLINWDNYPNNSVGGVYAWEKILVDSLTDFEFVVANIVSNPNVSGVYKIPAHVTKIIDVPLFGSFRYEEFYEEKGLFTRIMRTTSYTIDNIFSPLFEQLLQNLFSRRCDHKLLSEAIYQLHDLFLRFDVRKCIENPLAWDKYIEVLSNDSLFRNVSMSDARFVFQLVQRLVTNTFYQNSKGRSCTLLSCMDSFYHSNYSKDGEQLSCYRNRTWRSV